MFSNFDALSAVGLYFMVGGLFGAVANIAYEGDMAVTMAWALFWPLLSIWLGVQGVRRIASQPEEKP